MAVLVWLGYAAMGQSAQRATLLLDRHVKEQLALLWAGLTQDMKGAHATVLVPIAIARPAVEPPYDLAEAFARGFARFPYPESFFVWRDVGTDEGVTYVFNRADRPPRWHSSESVDVPYPVVVLRNPPAMRPFVLEARRQATFEQPSAVFETDVDGVPYQVIVSFQYDTASERRLAGLAGFNVNLTWVREQYFAELTGQIARVGGLSGDVSLGLVDESGRTVTLTRPYTESFAAVERSFALLFADPTLLGPRRDHVRPSIWTARATAARDSQLAAAVVGTNEGFLVMSGAAVAVLVGLLLTWRGVRVAANAARMKSEFVSTLTHELKTPLTVVRLLADTLARGRYDSPEAARGYASQLSRESQNLSSLIDHLLAYARLTYGHHAYTFEAVAVDELIDGVIEHFHTLLAEQAFTVTVHVAPEIPPVRGDRAALLQVLDNLVDNAIKYSDGHRALGIEAVAGDRGVTIGVTDRGVGIDDDEMERVCERFFRGRNVTVRGSGLGLAIARQIVDDHKGHLRIRSVRGQGTRVDVTLPAAA